MAGPAPRAGSPDSSLGLRAFHALVFCGFGAATVAGMLPELQQLSEGLFHRWHFGTPPSPIGATAALGAIALCLALVFFLARGRSAPLWMSMAMLVCFCAGLFGQTYEFSARSAPGANLAMLEVGKALQEKMRVQLQDYQRVSGKEADWQAALAEVSAGKPSPYRSRFFGAVPWRLETLAHEGDFPQAAPPGSFFVWVPKDESRFTLTMAGLDPKHQVVRLRDDRGDVFELRGTFTPDTSK